jgi:pyruvate,orthophosphate dikinase
VCTTPCSRPVSGEARRECGARDDSELDAATLRRLTGDFSRLLVQYAGEDLPQDPRTQLDRAVTAVFDSWNGDRARTYRRHAGIPDDLGTAVGVVEMVYGNTGPQSASGVCFTRDPLPVHRACTATTWPTPRARTSSTAAGSPPS